MESEVGYFRRNYLTPVPEFRSWDDLNDYLLSCCLEDAPRRISGKEHEVGTAMKLEREHLLPLAVEGFDIEERRFPTVDKKGCVRVGTNWLCLLFIHPPAHGSEVSPAARNTLDSARIPRASKLLICGLFLKGRVLAQDAVVSKNTNELKTRTPPISSLVRGDAVRRLMETKSERGSSSGLAYSVTCLTALRRGHAAPPNRREIDVYQLLAPAPKKP